MKNNQEEYNNFQELFEESKINLSNYIDKRLKLARLSIYEKLASAFSRIAYCLIICLMCLVFFLLAFISLGMFIGEQLNNYTLGFGILTLFLALVIVISTLMGKSIRYSLVNIILRTIKKIEQNEE